MKAIAIVAAGAAMGLGGCASVALQSYVGHSVEEIARRYGPPAQQVALPDGSEAFRWVFASGRAAAARYPLDMFVPLSVAAPSARRRASNAGLPLGEMCVYTVRAKWDKAAARWLVIGYDAPRIDCD